MKRFFGILTIAIFALAGCATYKGALDMPADFPDPAYISPANMDGVQDELLVDIDIPQVYKNMTVGGYEFIVSGANNETVYSLLIGSMEPKTGLFQKAKAVNIPDSVSWDGRDNDGAFAAEGAYTYYWKVWDFQGNSGETPKFTVIVDNTPPTVSVNMPYLKFSPDDDGKLDSIAFAHTKISEPAIWTGTIYDGENRKTRVFDYMDTLNSYVEWNGVANTGLKALDGEYYYQLTGRDLAGNPYVSAPMWFSLDTGARQLIVKAQYSHFSPNGDGSQDNQVLKLSAAIIGGINQWQVTIVNAETDAVVKTIKGNSPLPAEVVFDGKTQNGVLAEEGAYLARLQVFYDNGSVPVSESGQFILDIQGPYLEISAAYKVFSPDGDGRKDTLEIVQTTSSENLWTGTVKNTAGDTVYSKNWTGYAPSFIWDGNGNNLKKVPDGKYVYTLTGYDLAGNMASASISGIEKDTADAPVKMGMNYAAFSPNNDGSQDELVFTPQVTQPETVKSWTFNVSGMNDVNYYTSGAAGKVPETIKYDGRDSKGKILPDGNYLASLTVEQEKGLVVAGSSAMFSVDTIAPALRLFNYANTLFSPGTDGRKDAFTAVIRNSAELSWKAEIKDARNAVIREWTWNLTSTNLSWDGKDKNGVQTADGTYSLTVSCVDAAGNSLIRQVEGITTDTRSGSVSVSPAVAGFSPNNDGFYDYIYFDAKAEALSGILGWHADIVRKNNGVAHTLSGPGTPPARLSWDGMSKGKRVEDGDYSVKLFVEYEKGDLVTADSAFFALDASGPKASLTFAPAMFSPDNDGVNDKLTFSPSASDVSGLAKWELKISDPMGAAFKEFSGMGAVPASLTWDGYSDQMELVQAAEDYNAEFKVWDKYWNITDIAKIVPVDILVIKDGDRYRINISSIYFKPYTNDYLDVPADRKERNLATLSRLVEILKKFPAYRISVQGHAVQEHWSKPEKAAREEVEELIPLSLSRAEKIKEVLTESGVKNQLTATGLGGSRPAVPHSDYQNRWKNRRVEFILEK